MYLLIVAMDIFFFLVKKVSQADFIFSLIVFLIFFYSLTKSWMLRHCASALFVSSISGFSIFIYDSWFLPMWLMFVALMKIYGCKSYFFIVYILFPIEIENVESQMLFIFFKHKNYYFILKHILYISLLFI